MFPTLIEVLREGDITRYPALQDTAMKIHLIEKQQQTMDRIYDWCKSCGFEKSPRKSLAAEESLECVATECKLRYFSEPRKNPESRSIDLILLKACEKLQIVQKERYIMQQKRNELGATETFRMV